MLLLALCADAALGDPPTALHPVGWFGRAVRLLEPLAPWAPGARRRYGMAVAAGLPIACASAWALAARRGRSGGRVRNVVRDALALDMAFALRRLLARADEVRAALEAGDLERARRLLGTHLVSRETSALTASEVAGAAIESIAENLGDGVIAPWLAYACAGVPGAIAYRAINTLDAMWGYRTPPYGDLGWGAARLDDLANWLPARLTAAAICAAAAVGGGDARGAVGAWRRDRGATASPNAGHPMATMAGALGVTLTKRGAYRLGAPGREPVAADIRAATRLARLAAALAGGALAIAMLAADTHLP